MPIVFPLKRWLAGRLLAASLGLGTAVHAASPLPPLGARLDGLTVSGLSSGAYMAVQYQVAHARDVAGAGIVAGGPYYCAENSMARALTHCMAPTPTAAPPTAEAQRHTIERLAGLGRVDAPAHLRAQRVWLFSGANDHTVDRQVMDALAAFYRTLLPASAIRYERHAEAGHAMPSAADSQANACPTSEPPYINRCGDLDAAGEMLAHLLGPLAPRRPEADGQLLRFDQRPHVPGKSVDASLADEGYVYVPAACRAGGCRIHVAFHGCRQGAEAVGTRYVTGAGYNPWAAGNRLIVLYPQVRARYGLAWGSWRFVLNPKGCWDWWGYSGPEYPTRDGLQIRAVNAMIHRLAQPAAR